MNYYLILKLLPFLNIKKNTELTQNCELPVTIKPKIGHLVDFELVEKGIYTTTMMLKLNTPFRNRLSDVNLMVRLYHDVKLLEVMDKIGPKALKPINHSNNLGKKQVDEKRQLNRFLGESLKYCLQGIQI